MAVQLVLKHLQPLARGRTRLVFQHPQRPELLVKVMRPDMVEQRYGAGASWFRKARRRYDPYLLFLREIREYISAFAGHGRSLPFAQKVCGLVETDFGLGLLTEAVRGPDGALAPTLAGLARAGLFDQVAQSALERFFTDFLNSSLVVADLHDQNIVYACDADGTKRFVLIDGLGSSTILPFKSWSRWLNRRSKERRIARLRRKIALRLAALAVQGPLP